MHFQRNAAKASRAPTRLGHEASLGDKRGAKNTPRLDNLSMKLRRVLISACSRERLWRRCNAACDRWAKDDSGIGIEASVSSTRPFNSARDSIRKTILGSPLGDYRWNWTGQRLSQFRFRMFIIEKHRTARCCQECPVIQYYSNLIGSRKFRCIIVYFKSAKSPDGEIDEYLAVNVSVRFHRAFRSEDYAAKPRKAAVFFWGTL